jgi:hypothetical protein
MKGIWNLALSPTDEVAVQQHGGSTADRGTAHGCNQRLVEIDQCIHEPSLRRFSWARRIFQKVLHIVAGAESISRTVPKYHTYALVLGRGIEDVR